MARILVIDDHDESNRFVHRELEAQQHDVLSATNSEDALRVFRDKSPDIVLVELALRDEEGVVVLRELLTADPNAKVIAMTSTALALLRSARELGAVATLKKPYSSSRLIETIDRVLLMT